ncbi:MAG: GyrI-like domain-containing protein [Eubacteriaceae bacterium]|nr:GyrI-like domain-containing protein [Eubacteriaceae bacterium]
MAFDFKKEQKELYQPKTASIVDVPEMAFIMVDGAGNPNTSESYQTAVEILYGLSYTIKMSKKGDKVPEGYFDFTVPPLEGLWWLANGSATDYTKKDDFCWTSMIRQPDFVTSEVFEETKAAFSKKKPGLDLSLARLERFTEGLCAQILHIGSYDDEPESINKLEQFIAESGYHSDINDLRRHHELYLNDPRKTAPEKTKTVIRHPVRIC